MNQRQLEVVLNDQVIGDLKEVSDIWGFDYRREWLENPRSFDLSPAIGRFQQQHLDGSTTRPVQWFFDNLLPEEGMRALLSKEMKRAQGRCLWPFSRPWAGVSWFTGA